MTNNNLIDYSILFLSKNKPYASEAAEIVKKHIKHPTIVFGEISDPFPSYLLEKKFDYIISYISPWIVPKIALKNAKIASINFHPGPPEYPGIGCTNFAIYNEEKEFGITIHHMEEKVDSGKIIMVKRFPIFKNETVYSLTQRCYAFIYVAFVEIMDFIIRGLKLPECNIEWKRKPYTRKELNELCVITKDMPEEEVRKRVKATSFPNMPGAYLDLWGIKFKADYRNANEQSINKKADTDSGGGRTRKGPDIFSRSLAA